MVNHTLYQSKKFKLNALRQLNTTLNLSFKHKSSQPLSFSNLGSHHLPNILHAFLPSSSSAYPDSKTAYPLINQMVDPLLHCRQFLQFSPPCHQYPLFRCHLNKLLIMLPSPLSLFCPKMPSLPILLFSDAQLWSMNTPPIYNSTNHVTRKLLSCPLVK